TGGSIIQKRPHIYQEIEGKRVEIEGKYTLKRQDADFVYAFSVNDYNKEYALIIDPVIVYSTYLGGSDNERALGITVDLSGNAYITGWTASSNFPTKNAYDSSCGTDTYCNGLTDVFVAKINTSDTGNNSLIYSTFIGGSGSENANAIAIDSSGNAYITGWTASTDFPTTTGAFDTTHNGLLDVFVTKINPNGNGLIYSTFIGGDGDETGFGIAVDSSGNAYITGETGSNTFPTTTGAYDTTYNGGDYDTFVTKLNPTGSDLVYSTYLGGSGSETAFGIAVDSSNNAYITGFTNSTNFPTVNPIQSNNSGSEDAFVTKINASGSNLVYSTYLGGSLNESGKAIAVDLDGNAYVTGYTNSTNFPTVNPIQNSNLGGSDVFISKINTTGSALVYSTYLGGGTNESGNGISVDSSGNVYITGWTNSMNFPTVKAIQTHQGNDDAFVTKINAAGNSLVFSTYLGGSGNEQGYSIALCPTTSDIYVAGWTTSPNIPTRNAYQNSQQGNADAFITVIRQATACAPAPTGMISWWKAEDNANDSVGTNHGTLQNGATYATGKVGKAFSFNGINQYVQVPDSASLDVTTQFTLDAWIFSKGDAGGWTDKAIISKIGGSGGNNGYQLGLSPVGGNWTAYCSFNASGETWPANTVVGGIVTNNTWHHIACTYDNNKLKVYVNGVVVGTSNIGSKSVVNSSSTLRISGDDNNHAYFWGYIDEAEIYNRALTESEIEAIYLAGSIGKCASPPNPFSFTPITGVGLSSVVTSNKITVSGINNPTMIYIPNCTGTNCQYRINNGSWTDGSTQGSVSNGDIVTVRQTSSSDPDTQTVLTLYIGGVTNNFPVTTRSTNNRSLMVNKTGTNASAGVINTIPSGINCSGTCALETNFNQKVTLLFSPPPSWIQVGGNPSITGTNALTIRELNADTTVTVNFP
ncbi:MAG: SBBP repeat-containing protein, partial [Thermodesulfovibrionales bacterium]|nr:SBBP repeat-containing protein [Thermodesulfovibrionales bacterium]